MSQTITNTCNLQYSYGGCSVAMTTNNEIEKLDYNPTELVEFEKTANYDKVLVGSVVTYTVTIKATEVEIPVVWQETLPDGLELVTQTLKVDGMVKEDDILYVAQSSLGVGETLTIEYQCTVL